MNGNDAANPAALASRANEVRRELLRMIHTARSGHPGGSLSAADLMTALYFSELRLNPQDPHWAERDRFILSKGHACPVLYTCLALRGYFPREALATLRQYGSILQGHPDMKRCPGVDISTGSLGQGLSVGVGMAIAAKRDGRTWRVFVLLGDGETQEGQVWEAVESAAKYRLDNLVILVDHNRLQNDGPCEQVMPLISLRRKFAAFGCATAEIDGHSMTEILGALRHARQVCTGRPHCIIARTVKGRGVSFMENNPTWHGTAPNDAEYTRAIAELEEARL